MFACPSPQALEQTRQVDDVDQRACHVGVGRRRENVPRRAQFLLGDEAPMLEQRQGAIEARIELDRQRHRVHRDGGQVGEDGADEADGDAARRAQNRGDRPAKR
jgi:hypothetical protein